MARIVKLNNIYYPLFNITLLFFVLILIFDPSNNIFGLKLPLFLTLLSFGLMSLCATKHPLTFTRASLILIIFICIISTWGYIIGLTWHGPYSATYANYYATSLAPTLLLLPILWLNSNFEKIFLGALAFFVVISLIFSVLLLFDFHDYLYIVKILNYKYRVAKIGFRIFGDIRLPMFYYKTTILTVFFIGPLLTPKGKLRLIYLGIAVFVLFISGTRANMLVACAALYVYAYNCIVRYFPKYKGFFLCVSCFTILIILALLSNELLDTFLRANEKSNSIKIDHLMAYMSLFSEHPLHLLFGFGYGSGMYSSGIAGIGYTFELSYFEIIRFLGLIGGALLGLILLYPLVALQQKNRGYLFSWLTYLGIAGTNPYIFSSTGALALTFIYYIILSDKKIVRKADRLVKTNIGINDFTQGTFQNNVINDNANAPSHRRPNQPKLRD